MLQFPEHIERVSVLAEVSELRHRVISHNIANVNTPGYQRLDVSFDEHLFKARRQGQASEGAAPSIVQEPGEITKMDGNNVDIDSEIGHLNQNSMVFQMYSQILSTHLNTMRRALGQ
ncbi:Flagellar basal body rod protein FlgB [Thalassoglobus polymorphus]|uniref:Flagellar basal body rod protein FlgB n=1 Tax=Thalassoglobus polymorphus TaxID=2527994 RepID=A0A517QME5_9PLAN|nr:Flagellar basal body rod protein FlgB [Thalassoglobus polymorphus]